MKYPQSVSKKEMVSFFNKVGLKNLVKSSSKSERKIKDLRLSKVPYKPDLTDLYRLFKFVTLNKRTTILEYGTGWSTLVFHLALEINKKKFAAQPFKRCSNPYKLFVVDNDKKFIRISKKRIKNFSKRNKNIKFTFSNAFMTKYKGKYVSYYKNHPRVNPDLIYLDGPDQYKIKNKINNFTINHPDMMPMASDILSYEHFLTAGTIIIVDGRTANARFLKINLQRKWKYRHFEKYDQSIFYLNEKPLGKYNREQLRFYKT